MALSDRIRARVRNKDCFFAIFPDKGFSVLSPMNDKVFPVPGSNTTGNKDIDDGLATINYNSLATGDSFDFISGNYGARFYANANLSGQTPNHTIIFRAFVTDLTTQTEYPYVYRVGMFFNGFTDVCFRGRASVRPRSTCRGRAVAGRANGGWCASATCWGNCWR